MNFHHTKRSPMLLTHKENILKFSWLLPSFLSLFLFGSTVKAAAIAKKIAEYYCPALKEVILQPLLEERE
ncbi:MAG: hypothetical protein HWQ35_18070 [Nostoc sp. NMS1]|uniref:hypothetical protein n=2 Tax=unclassified Nostoc TaxID=2593658 RepID=UPI0025F6F1C2|nr:hypothetical protein [Nostoc sp. NMS2]MBN3908374.1 hypothetical protein [Nostoc sp. NMS1]MBN3993636.1 hypothetical protein [Nostoc sp. NMS2]